MRTLFIGDLHGCAREFEQLLSKLEFQRDSDLLFLTGDAFSRGPDPAGVWKLIQDTGANMVLGNHDYRLADRLRRHLSGAAVPMRSRDTLKTLETLAPCADALIPWLESLPLWIDEPEYLLVHAGINPEKGFTARPRKNSSSSVPGRPWTASWGPDGTMRTIHPAS